MGPAAEAALSSPFARAKNLFLPTANLTRMARPHRFLARLKSGRLD